MIPRAWVVEWGALGNIPAGNLEFPQRARARGFFMVRKAAGFTVRIAPRFH
jgi:hypothetical protein